MLDRIHVISALASMQGAYNDLRDFFSSRGIDNFEDDVCRRNLMMSVFHESYFTQAFTKQFGSARNDGRTGEADIIIETLGREVECKLTTVTPTGGFNLQTDYKTLQRKGELDYLYVLTNRDFSAYAVLYFEGLTTDDFHPPARSSRGKARMKKHEAFSKCHVLFGDVEDRTAINLAKARRNLANCSDHAVKRRQKLEQSIQYWAGVPASYTITPLPLSHDEIKRAA